MVWSELRPGSPLDKTKLHYWKKKQRAVATAARLAYASVQEDGSICSRNPYLLSWQIFKAYCSAGGMPEESTENSAGRTA